MIFTPDELSAFTGKPKGTPIYLAIVGDVFDVTSGRQHYGPGKSYSHMAGRDATKSFATGDSQNDLTDDVEGLDMEALQSIKGWHEFYVGHENYTRMGVVIGRYYDASGDAIVPSAFPWERLKLDEERREAMKRSLPDCNSRWSQADGSEVWCTTKSGGIERDWVGVPRLYSPSLDPSLEGESSGRERCVCAPSEEADKVYLRVYSGCEPSAERCKVIKSS